MKTDVTDKSTSEAGRGKREFFVVVAAGLLIGILLGWWGERTARGGIERADPVVGEVREPVDLVPEDDGDRLMRAWMESLAGMGRRVVPERTVVRLAIRPLTEAGEVSHACRELFLLTSEETDRVNGLIAEMEERLLLAEMMHLEILDMSDHEAVFLIPVLDEGVEIEHTLRDGLLEILGEADGNLFWALLQAREREGFPDRWRGFGQREREIVFSLSDGDPREFSADPVPGEVVGWLRYAERVSDDPLWFSDSTAVPRVEVKRVRPLLLENESDGEGESRFFDPRRERYGFLVPLLPDPLRPYFQ